MLQYKAVGILVISIFFVLVFLIIRSCRFRNSIPCVSKECLNTVLDGLDLCVSNNERVRLYVKLSSRVSRGRLMSPTVLVGEIKRMYVLSDHFYDDIEVYIDGEANVEIKDDDTFLDLFIFLCTQKKFLHA